jgi:hypothetical protein
MAIKIKQKTYIFLLNNFQKRIDQEKRSGEDITKGIVR